MVKLLRSRTQEPPAPPPSVPAQLGGARKAGWGDLAELSLHGSAKARHALIDGVVAANRLDEWLIHVTSEEHGSDDNRRWFFEKLWVKGLPRVSQADLSLSGEGVESLLAQLDAGESATVISPDGYTTVDAEALHE